MSFTSTVKTEVSKLEINDVEKIAELSAIILAGAVIKKTNIKIDTENASVARRIFNLTKSLYKVVPTITVRRIKSSQKRYIYILNIKSKVDYILKDLGLIENNEILEIPKNYVLDDEETIRAYLRGVFLMSGSVNDPKKSRYHLEFLVNSESYSMYIKELLNKYNLNSKVIKRDAKYMVYVKEAEKIGDFLRIMNAYNSVLYYEDIRIYRDHKNMTNRLNNCEQANIDRIIETANTQINDIELIKEKVGLELLDEKEQIVANYRLKYKDASLVELSEIISIETEKNITKSGLYHRFKKIKELADKIRKNCEKI